MKQCYIFYLIISLWQAESKKQEEEGIYQITFPCSLIQRSCWSSLNYLKKQVYYIARRQRIFFFTCILCHWHPLEAFNSENKSNNFKPDYSWIVSLLINLYVLTVPSYTVLMPELHFLTFRLLLFLRPFLFHFALLVRIPFSKSI